MFTLKNQLLTPLLAFSLVTTQHSVALASPSFDKQTSIEWLSDQGIPLTQGTDFHTTANITPSDLATQIETLASLMTQIATLQNAAAQEMQPAESNKKKQGKKVNSKKVEKLNEELTQTKSLLENLTRERNICKDELYKIIDDSRKLIELVNEAIHINKSNINSIYSLAFISCLLSAALSYAAWKINKLNNMLAGR